MCELEKYKENRGAYKHTYLSAMLVRRLATDVWSADDVRSANVHDSNIGTSNIGGATF